MGGMDRMSYIVGHDVRDEIHRVGAQRGKSGNFAQEKGGHSGRRKTKTVSFAVRGK